MDPLTIGALLAGTALKTGGGIFGRNEAQENANRIAQARNAALAQSIAKQQGYYDQNKIAFDNNMAGYAAPAQAERLSGAQDTRSAGNTGNITQTGVDGLPLQQDASPMVRSEIAKRMLGTFNQSTERAKAMGKLGGYSDAWLQNELGNRQADRDISVQNLFSNNEKALLNSKLDTAAAGAPQEHSIWGPLMSGAGSLMSSAAGGGFFGGFGGAAAPSDSLGFAMPSARM